MLEPGPGGGQAPAATELATSSIRARVASLSGPALAEMILTTLTQMVDLIMVGRLGTHAITAVGLTNQLVFFGLDGFNALGVGTTALVARSIGSGDVEQANTATRQSLVLALLLSGLLSVLGYLGARQLLAAMGAAPDVVEYGTIYIAIISLGFVFAASALTLSAALRGAGDTRTPMRVNVFANVFNVVGNYALIYGRLGFPQLGIAGAAIATSLARLLACGLTSLAVVSGRFPVTVRLTDDFRPDLAVLRRIWVIGFPASVEQFILRSGMLVYTRIVAGLGTTIFAAHQIAMNILGLSFMPGMAFAIAAATLVGQSLGARNPELAQRCAQETRRLGVLVSGAMAALLFFFGPWIIRLYTDNAAVVQHGALALKIIAIVQPAQSTQFILAGALRGAGDTTWPLYSTFIGIWGIRLVLAYVLAISLTLGLFGAWVAVAIDQCVRSAIILFRFNSGKWKTARV